MRKNKLATSILSFALVISMVLQSGPVVVNAQTDETNSDSITVEYEVDEESLEPEVIEINDFASEYVNAETDNLQLLNSLSETTVEFDSAYDNFKDYAYMTSSNKPWYYDSLSENEQAFYDTLDATLQEYLTDTTLDAVSINASDDVTYYATKEIDYCGLTSDEALKIAVLAIYNEPYYFFTSSAFLQTDTGMHICFLEDFVDGEIRIINANQIFREVNKWIDACSDDEPTDLHKEDSVYELVCGKLDYVSNDYDQSVYSALILRQTVCAGYAEVTSMILNKIGIDTAVVFSSNHAWNAVKLNDSFYGLDNTWNDTCSTEPYKLLFNVSATGITSEDIDANEGAHDIESEYENLFPVLADADYGVSEDTCEHANVSVKYRNEVSVETAENVAEVCVGYEMRHNVTGEVVTDALEWCESHGCAWHGFGDGELCGSNRSMHPIYESFFNPAVYTIESQVAVEYCLDCTYEKVLDSYEDTCSHQAASTYATDSYNHYTVCSICNKHYDSSAAHTFDDGVVTVTPSTSSAGEKTYTCTTCDFSYSELLAWDTTACSHTYEYEYNETNHWQICSECNDVISTEEHTMETEVTVEPTEESEGTETHTCSVCGYTYDTTLDKLVHSHTLNETLSYDENNHWQTCSTCTSEIDVTAHTWDDPIVTKEATELLEGELRYDCTGCDYYKLETVEKLPHTTHVPVDEWSYDETNHWKVCSNDECDEILEKSTHIWGDGVVTVEPTETTKGSKRYTCTCGKTKDEDVDVLPHTSHTYNPTYLYNDTGHWQECTFSGCGMTTTLTSHNMESTVTKQPTTEEEGIRRYDCNVCDYFYTEPIEKLHSHVALSTIYYDDTNHWQKCECGEIMNQASHSLDDGTVETQPTEESEGLMVYKCKTIGCEYTETSSIEKLEHVCAATGDWSYDDDKHWHMCKCNNRLDEDGHSFSEVDRKDATEESEGYIVNKCSVCNMTKTVILEKLPHTHNVSTKWSHDEDSHWKTCSCDDTLRFEESTHNFDTGVVTKEPTVDEFGIRVYTCDDCDYEKEENIDKLPEPEHVHEALSKYYSDDSNHWNLCECGEKMNIDGHSYDNGVVTKEPTTTEYGVRTYTCSICNHTKTENIDKIVEPDVPEEEPSITVPTPSNLRVTDVTETSVKFIWDKSITDLDITYELQFAYNSDFNPIAATKESSSNAISVTHLSPDDTVYIKVRAIKTVDGTVYVSDWVQTSATTLPVDVSEPEDVKVTNVTDKSADISWISDESEFAVALYENEELIDIYRISDKSYAFTELKAETNYEVKVMTIRNVGGEDCYSDAIVVAFTTIKSDADDNTNPDLPQDDDTDDTPVNPDEPTEPPTDDDDETPPQDEDNDVPSKDDETPSDDEPDVIEEVIIPTHVQPTSARVEWTVKSNVSKYEIFIYKDSLRKQKVAQAVVDSKAVTIYGLKANTKYYIDVRAINIDGSSTTYSKWVNCDFLTSQEYKASENETIAK